MNKGLFRLLVACPMIFLMGLASTVQAWPYCGGWGVGYGYGGCWGPGWTPCGLGTVAVAAPVAYAAPVVYAPPAYASVGYYQPPQAVVVEKKVSRPPADPPSNTLAKAEAKLAGLGYYKGSVDGEYGPVIQQAIQQFQSDNGLPVSGRLDLKTLSSLGIAL